MAAAWHGHPARRLVMVGVTGTDGKTTTATMLHAMLRAAGLRAGLITSVYAQIGDHNLDTGFHVTTPDALDLQGYLARMVDAGLSHCVLEATSHGLAQGRVDACEFDVAVVTNVTHEHLDYHRTYRAYLEAKGRLFSGLADSRVKAGGPQKTAILNRDDSSYDYLGQVSGGRVISYSLGQPADFVGHAVRSGGQGLSMLVTAPGEERPIHTPLLGRHNAHNCLAAYAAAVAGLGLPAEAAARGLADIQAVPGRMERIDLGQRFAAVVDFAHTPNALRAALETARDLTEGRVIAVFGSAGQRDRAKRRMMAEVSARLADLTVLTAEDPRTESLGEILDEMARGAVAAGGAEAETFFRVPDRGEAIRFAVRQARPGDLVIVCGKGHEQSMCFGEIEYAWDDRLAVRAALAELLGVEGPAMPRLPTSGMRT
jgi:UDP-N-acetylmuramoyl-L-alanyl-D-glutamate--2,6-diaminopimelate ligase